MSADNDPRNDTRHRLGLPGKQIRLPKTHPEKDTSPSRPARLLDLGITLDTSVTRHLAPKPKQVFPPGLAQHARTDSSGSTSSQAGPGNLKKRLQHVPTPLKLDDISPFDRYIPIALEAPATADALTIKIANSRSKELSPANGDNPAIILTPTEETPIRKDATSKARDTILPRPPSSVYTRAVSTFSKFPTPRTRLTSRFAKTPRTPGRDWPLRSAKSDVTNLDDDDSPCVVPFQKTPTSSRAPLQRSASIDTVLPTPRRSVGWWNLLASPLIVHSNSLRAKLGSPREEDIPEVPLLEDQGEIDGSEAPREGEATAEKQAQDLQDEHRKTMPTFYYQPTLGEAAAYYDPRFSFRTSKSESPLYEDGLELSRDGQALFHGDDDHVALARDNSQRTNFTVDSEPSHPKVGHSPEPDTIHEEVPATLFADARREALQSQPTLTPPKSAAAQFCSAEDHEAVFSPKSPSPELGVASIGRFQSARAISPARDEEPPAGPPVQASREVGLPPLPSTTTRDLSCSDDAASPPAVPPPPPHQFVPMPEPYAYHAAPVSHPNQWPAPPAYHFVPSPPPPPAPAQFSPIPMPVARDFASGGAHETPAIEPMSRPRHTQTLAQLTRAQSHASNSGSPARDHTVFGNVRDPHPPPRPTIANERAPPLPPPPSSRTASPERPYDEKAAIFDQAREETPKQPSLLAKLLDQSKTMHYRSPPSESHHQAQKKWTRHRLLFIAIAALLFVVLLLTVVLSLTVTLSHSDMGVETQWLNLTNYPPMPTGISTVAQVKTTEKARCVENESLWTCAAPRSEASLNLGGVAGQPNFRLEVRFKDAVVKNNTLSKIKRSRRYSSGSTRAAALVSEAYLQARDTFSDLIYSASPAAPDDGEQKFLGNTTDGIIKPFDGENTPFYISFLPSTNVTQGLQRRDQVSNSTALLNQIPAPLTASNGSAASPVLYPFPSAQPVHLYNRGRDDEHYGFHTFFDKSVLVRLPSAIQATSESSTNNSTDDGGSSIGDANAMCVFSQTRFHVQIWTRSAPLAAPLTTTNGTLSAEAFGGSGSFPYPITFSLDRHGGDATRKAVYCYGLDSSGLVQKNQKAIIPEDRGVGGTLVNPATAFTAPAANAGDYGGVDGGTGGCSCAWRN